MTTHRSLAFRDEESGDHDYCRVFVRSADRPALESLVAVALHVRPVGGVFVLDGVDVEVRPNPDGSPSGSAGIDFIKWPSQVEFDAAADGRPSAMIEAVKATLGTLWDDGIDAVAAADFEHELPWSGGIQRSITPR